MSLKQILLYILCIYIAIYILAIRLIVLCLHGFCMKDTDEITDIATLIL